MADLFDIVTARKLSGGGGGGTTVEALSVTQNGTYTAPSGKAYSPVTVNVSGGSSDFSTATVTVTITKEAAYFDIPSVINTPIETLMNYQCNWTNGGGQFITPLYKGSAYLPANIPLDANTSATGDVIIDGEAFYITGDCTITIS